MKRNFRQMMLIINIAKECHSANDDLMLVNNEVPNLTDWHQMDDHTRSMNIKSVSKIIDNKYITAKDLHNEWMDNKIADGWKYGTVKNPELKTHPLIIEFEKMSDINKLKDQNFIDIVNKHRNEYEGLSK